MNKVRIVYRQLTDEEAQDFSREMTLTPNITGYRHKELMALKDVLVAEVAGKTVGMLAYVELRTFIDLKILLVKTADRGNGYGKLLMETTLKHFGGTGKLIYAVTRNPIVIGLLEGSGFARVRFRQLPLPCQLHQIKMAFSLYRMKEALRKSRAFPHQPAFAYYAKLQ